MIARIESADPLEGFEITFGTIDETFSFEDRCRMALKSDEYIKGLMEWFEVKHGSPRPEFRYPVDPVGLDFLVLAPPDRCSVGAAGMDIDPKQDFIGTVEDDLHEISFRLDLESLLGEERDYQHLKLWVCSPLSKLVQDVDMMSTCRTYDCIVWKTLLEQIHCRTVIFFHDGRRDWNVFSVELRSSLETLRFALLVFNGNYRMV